MWILGLTGGIGSGKSLASRYFSRQGITVVDADQVARDVVEPGQPAWLAIRSHFGPQVLQADERLDRAWLRQRVFANPDDRRWLEQQTHPRIRERITLLLQQAQSPYAILESPLLFESGQHQLTQRTLLIDADEALQLQRACARDGNNADQIRRIMAAQMPRTERRNRADDIVTNNGTEDELYAQLQPLHRAYLSYAGH